MTKMERREALFGVTITLIGGIFWGLSGVFGQYLFVSKGTNTQWLVSVRLIISGLFLLTTVWFKQRDTFFKIWTNKKHLILLILFSIFGMIGCQFSYYRAIELSNAGTATVLQYTSPVLILGIESFRNRRKPKRQEIFALILALSGTFLLATHGDLNQLAISQSALFWGLSSSVMMAVYNLLPVGLMKEYGTFYVIGWGMFIGGIIISFFTKPWHVVGHWDLQAVGAMSVVIVFGTLLSFSLYMEGVQLIGASRASLLASIEPVTATIASVLFMHVIFTGIDVIGILCIIGAVFILSIKGSRQS